MKARAEVTELLMLGAAGRAFNLYLCTHCERLEVFEAEDGRWIRRTYYDGAPVLHKALRG